MEEDKSLSFNQEELLEVKIIKGYFNGCVGILEGYHFNKAIVKIEVEHRNNKEELTLLLKTTDFKKYKNLN